METETRMPSTSSLLDKMDDIMPSIQTSNIIIGTLIIYLVASFINKVRKELKSPLHKIPGPWYAPWTAMHLRYLFAKGTIWKYVHEQHQKYGPIIRLGPRQTWVSDIDAIKQVLYTIDLPKVAMYSEISRDRFSPGLFGEIRRDPHRRLKKFLNPAFTTTYVDGLEFLFQHCVDALLRRYYRDSAGGTKEFKTDLMDDLHNVALDIMGECSFGKGFGQTDPESQPIEGVGEKIWKAIPYSIFKNQAEKYGSVYVKRFLRRLGWDIKFDWSPDMIRAIDATVKVRSKDFSTHRPDLLQHVVEEGKRPDTGVKMGTREIIDQMAEILLAGSETTSGTLVYLFIQIARNPDVKEKLFKSLPPLALTDPAIGGKQVRTDPQFEYLNACISETLRMHPIASELGRRTGTDWFSFSDYNFPPHTVVSASYRELHHNEEFWPEAERFWPERWLAEEKRNAAGAPEPDYKAYYPFSAGRHNCIGQNFAWAEMRTVTANLLSRYDIVEIPDQVIDYRQYITLQITDGKWKVALTPRTVSKTGGHRRADSATG